MTEKLRETRYARELAAAKLPSRPGRKSFVAIERIHVKKADQVEIRFSSWAGTRMLPRPLNLPEEELLPLLEAALRAGVFSETFTQGLRSVLAGTGAPPEPAASTATDLEKVQAHFHTLIRSRAGDRIGDQASSLPELSKEDGLRRSPPGSRWTAWTGASSTGGTRQRRDSGS